MAMTIKDIARLSGCSVSTVSRVLNHHPDVTDKTREKVMSVVREYQFQPNTNAKFLKQQQRTSVAIIVRGRRNMLFADLVEQMQLHLEEYDLTPAIYYIDEYDNEVEYAIRLTRSRNPMGIAFLGGDATHFREGFTGIDIPCIMLTNSSEALGFDNLSSVTTDDRAAAAQMVEHLISLGHRNIGIVGGDMKLDNSYSYRLQGCIDAAGRHGLRFDFQTQYESCRFTVEAGYEAAQRLLDRVPETTAIFALSDLIAIGVVRALADRGKRVPEDISVAGFDGTDGYNYFVPRLTTIIQDAHLIAERGVDILLKNIDRKVHAVHERTSFELYLGESVAPPSE